MVASTLKFSVRHMRDGTNDQSAMYQHHPSCNFFLPNLDFSPTWIENGFFPTWEVQVCTVFVSRIPPTTMYYSGGVFAKKADEEITEENKESS